MIYTSSPYHSRSSRYGVLKTVLTSSRMAKVHICPALGIGLGIEACSICDCSKPHVPNIRVVQMLALELCHEPKQRPGVPEEDKAST